MAVTLTELRKLLQRSGNLCAYPGCTVRLTSAATDVDRLVVMGEVAHIVGESPEGPRGDSPLSKTERNRYENLILLCHLHHELIDSQPNSYTVEWLLDTKAQHERWVEKRLGSDDVAVNHETKRPAAAVDLGKLDTVGAQRDPGLLGIHPAIPLREARPGLNSRLPTYVERDVDADLRRELANANQGGSFIVLVGGTVSGKSRTAWESITAMLPDWRLFVPVEAKDINGLANTDLGAGKIVVWIDELKPLLDDPNLSARTFRDLLGNAGAPVVIVGGIWPEDYDTLTRPPTPTKADRCQRARQVLKLGRRVDMPSAFSRTELERIGELADIDPRLHEALFHATGHQSPVAVLASAPELISAFTTAAPGAGRAVVEAAVEARLSGHSKLVPAELLQALAELRLTPEQRARASADWFALALTWACTPVRGVVPMLKPFAHKVGQVDAYEVSDILASFVFERGQFRHADVAAAVWEALSGTSDIDSCLWIGINALQLGQIASGRRALKRCADNGVDLASVVLAHSYFDEGDLDEALRSFTCAHELGDPDAASMIGVIYAELGKADQARQWLLVAADAGNPGAMVGLGQMEEDAGNAEEAYDWYSQAADLGFPEGLTCLGGLHAAGGERHVADGLWRQAAAAGEPMAMMNLARSDWMAGKALGAQRWWRAAAELGNVEAMVWLAEALWRARGDQDEAIRWARTAAEEGYVPAFGMLGQLLSEREHTAEEGLLWLQRGAEAGDDNAIARYGEALDDLGDSEAAVRWMDTLARKPDAPAAAQSRYGIYLCQLGRTEEALVWIRAAHGSSDRDAIRLLTIAAQEYPAIAEVIHADLAGPAGPRLVPPPDRVQWTPILQRCDCVIDWGWDYKSDPYAFMMWCLQMTTRACLWDGGDGTFPEIDREATISLRLNEGGACYLARRAVGHDITLGRELTRQLTELAASSREQLVAAIPERVLEFYIREGYEPADAWFDNRMTDIVLNRGATLDWEAIGSAEDGQPGGRSAPE